MKKQFIYEPMTAFTDLLITAMGIYFCRELFTHFGETAAEFHRYWGWAFFMAGFGAFLGAVSHGIGPHFSPMIKKSLWKLTTLSVGGVAVFFLLTVVHLFPELSMNVWIKSIPIAAYLIYAVVIFKNDRFLNVILFYVPAMIVVLIAMLYSQFSLGLAGAGFVSIGILISFAGAGIQASKAGFHKHFNHNDLYHVIQMIGMWFFYKGALQLMPLQQIQ